MHIFLQNSCEFYPLEKTKGAWSSASKTVSILQPKHCHELEKKPPFSPNEATFAKATCSHRCEGWLPEGNILISGAEAAWRGSVEQRSILTHHKALDLLPRTFHICVRMQGKIYQICQKTQVTTSWIFESLREKMHALDLHLLLQAELLECPIRFDQSRQLLIAF